MSERNDDKADQAATSAPAPAPTETAQAPITDAEQDEEAPPAGKAGGKTAWVGAAVGIGSAAIVAALLYANKRKG